MKRTLIVIDMQNDFLYGSLKNEAALAIIPHVKKKIEEYLTNGDEVIFTRDTHKSDYLSTNEGRHLPIKHCVYGTHGWLITDALSYPECRHINKTTFGYRYWEYEGDFESIEIVGTCTGICVVSNALILKAQFPEVNITVDASCCACVTPESHKNALEVMKLCQINVIGE